jgi:hypothetical protein
VGLRQSCDLTLYTAAGSSAVIVDLSHRNHSDDDCSGALCYCVLRIPQPVPGLELPLVVTDDVLVRYADQRCYPPNTPPSMLPGISSSSAAAAAAGDSEATPAESAAAVWSQLELGVAGGEAPSTNWLDGAKQVRVVHSILLTIMGSHL